MFRAEMSSGGGFETGFSREVNEVVAGLSYKHGKAYYADAAKRLSCAFRCDEGSLLVAFVMYRSDALSYPDSWQEVYDGAEIAENGMVQRLAVLSKTAKSRSEELYLSQGGEQRIMCNIVEVKNASSASLYGEITGTQQTGVLLEKESGRHFILWGGHTVTMSMGAVFPLWSATPDDLCMVQQSSPSASRPRLWTLVDNGETVERSVSVSGVAESSVSVVGIKVV